MFELTQQKTLKIRMEISQQGNNGVTHMRIDLSKDKNFHARMNNVLLRASLALHAILCISCHKIFIVRKCVLGYDNFLYFQIN